MSEPAGRLEGFDLLRAAAILGVVWIHGCDTSAWAFRMSRLAAPAVPIFILISFYLLQRSILRNPEAGGGQLLRRRLMRLVPPYAIWSAVYLVVRMLRHRLLPAAHGADGFDLVSVLWLGGASYQLYFIAALIYWSLLALPVALWLGRTARLRRPGAAVLAASGAVLLGAGRWLLPQVQIAPEHSLLAHALLLSGYVPLGLAAALCPGPDFSGPVRWKLQAALITIAAGLCLVHPRWGWPVFLAVTLFAWGLVYRGAPMPAWIRRVSLLSYGIYFVHGFFVEGFQTVALRLGWPLDSAGAAMGVIGLAFAASWGACEILYRVPRARFLVS